MLVPFADSAAIAREVCALLGDGERRRTMCQQAYLLGREMTWSRVAEAYAASFTRAQRQRAKPPRPTLRVRTLADEPLRLPPFNPDHVLRLTDSTGMLQHAHFAFPRLDHGYCTDDNARALILALDWEALGETSSTLSGLSTRYACFLAHALHPETKRFRNFMGYDRRWREDAGSEDSHGRALWALGACVAHDRDPGLTMLAKQLFAEALPAVESMGHPRTWAFALLGIHAFLRRKSGDKRMLEVRKELTQRLMQRFAAHTRDDWQWFADDATYENARLPQALILSGHTMKQPEVFETGLRALDWLIRIQTSATRCFQPIGSNGFIHRNGGRAFFDQQPVEVQGVVAAALDAFRLTGDGDWIGRAHAVFDWFLGRYDLGLMLYDARTGGCRDALHADRANENQGAESTLAFHLARADLRRVHNELAVLPWSRPSTSFSS